MRTLATILQKDTLIDDEVVFFEDLWEVSMRNLAHGGLLGFPRTQVRLAFYPRVFLEEIFSELVETRRTIKVDSKPFEATCRKMMHHRLVDYSRRIVTAASALDLPVRHHQFRMKRIDWLMDRLEQRSNKYPEQGLVLHLMLLCDNSLPDIERATGIRENRASQLLRQGTRWLRRRSRMNRLSTWLRVGRNAGETSEFAVHLSDEEFDICEPMVGL